MSGTYKVLTQGLATENRSLGAWKNCIFQPLNMLIFSSILWWIGFVVLFYKSILKFPFSCKTHLFQIAIESQMQILHLSFDTRIMGFSSLMNFLQKRCKGKGITNLDFCKKWFLLLLLLSVFSLPRRASSFLNASLRFYLLWQNINSLNGAWRLPQSLKWKTHFQKLVLGEEGSPCPICSIALKEPVNRAQHKELELPLGLLINGTFGDLNAWVSLFPNRKRHIENLLLTQRNFVRQNLLETKVYWTLKYEASFVYWNFLPSPKPQIWKMNSRAQSHPTFHRYCS